LFKYGIHVLALRFFFNYIAVQRCSETPTTKTKHIGEHRSASAHE